MGTVVFTAAVIVGVLLTMLSERRLAVLRAGQRGPQLRAIRSRRLAP